MNFLFSLRFIFPGPSALPQSPAVGEGLTSQALSQGELCPYGVYLYFLLFRILNLVVFLLRSLNTTDNIPLCNIRIVNDSIMLLAFFSVTDPFGYMSLAVWMCDLRFVGDCILSMRQTCIMFFMHSSEGRVKVVLVSSW